MLAACRAVQAGLFGLEPWDPLTLTGAVLIITVMTVMAAFLPARRGTTIDPVVALRLRVTLLLCHCAMTLRVVVTAHVHGDEL
jgi:hypothetical protein